MQNNYCGAGYGGAVYCHSISLLYPNTSQFVSCQILGNSSFDYGGGLAFGEAAAVGLDRCLIAGNSSDTIGGGLGTWSGTAQIQHCTLAGNSAGWLHLGGGAAAWGVAGSIEFTNTIIAFNVGTEGGGLWPASKVAL